MNNAKLHTASLPFFDRGERTVWIYSPECKEGESLPVIYMTDGQNLFDESATVHGCWDVVGAVENEGKPCVIVGIDNGNEYRDNELTPKCIGEIQHRELLCDGFIPQGELFDDFLMNTVIPYVENNFPVKTNRESVSVCGSSSGGLQAFYEGIEHGDKFSCVGAFSPAFLCYDNEAWREYLKNKICGELPYLYIYSGGGDELEQMIFESVEIMYDLLGELFYPYDKLNEVVLFENRHNEKAWKEIFPDFLHTFLERQ